MNDSSSKLCPPSPSNGCHARWPDKGRGSDLLVAAEDPTGEGSAAAAPRQSAAHDDPNGKAGEQHWPSALSRGPRLRARGRRAEELPSKLLADLRDALARSNRLRQDQGPLVAEIPETRTCQQVNRGGEKPRGAYCHARGKPTDQGEEGTRRPRSF